MKNSQQEYYAPDREEIESAATFMKDCSAKDLAESWVRISQEWDPGSLMRLHENLCKTGRIDDLVSFFTDT